MHNPITALPVEATALILQRAKRSTQTKQHRFELMFRNISLWNKPKQQSGFPLTSRCKRHGSHGHKLPSASPRSRQGCDVMLQGPLPRAQPRGGTAAVLAEGCLAGQGRETYRMRSSSDTSCLFSWPALYGSAAGLQLGCTKQGSLPHQPVMINYKYLYKYNCKYL